MYYHIVINPPELDVMERIKQSIVDRPFWMALTKLLAVQETSGSGKLHFHVLLQTDEAKAKLSRELLLLRDGKIKGVSIRVWDNDISYLCKGECPNTPPVIILKVGYTDDEIREAQQTHWLKPPPQDNDRKEMYNLLCEWTREQGDWSYVNLPEAKQKLNHRYFDLYCENEKRLPMKHLYARDIYSVINNVVFGNARISLEEEFLKLL